MCANGLLSSTMYLTEQLSFFGRKDLCYKIQAVYSPDCSLTTHSFSCFVTEVLSVIMRTELKSQAGHRVAKFALGSSRGGVRTGI
jgi:hypothetical protein